MVEEEEEVVGGGIVVGVVVNGFVWVGRLFVLWVIIFPLREPCSVDIYSSVVMKMGA